MEDGEDDNVIIQSEHKKALTDKGLEEKLHSKVNARRGNLNEVENKQLKIYK